MKGEVAGSKLEAARDEFVGQWGAIGTKWGINRTLAQIHALLLTAADPMSTDEVMEELGISRGNANTNLRELVEWGLIRSVLRKGERKEFFEAEKDVWEMACIIARERKRREIDPAMGVVRECQQMVADEEGEAAEAFRAQMGELLEFMKLGGNMLEKTTTSGRGKMLKMASKLLS